MSSNSENLFTKDIVERACRVLDRTTTKDTKMPASAIASHWSIIEDCLFIVNRAKLEGYPQLNRSKEARKGRKYLIASIAHEHFDKIQEVLAKGLDLFNLRIEYKSCKVLPLAAQYKRPMAELNFEVTQSLKPSPTITNIQTNLPKPKSEAQPLQQQAIVGTMLQILSAYKYAPGQLLITSVYDDILLLARQIGYDLELLVDTKILPQDQQGQLLRVQSVKKCLPNLLSYLLAHPEEDPNTLMMLGSDPSSFELLKQKDPQFDLNRPNAIQTKKKQNCFQSNVPTNLPEFDKICKKQKITIDEVIRRTVKQGYDWEKIFNDLNYRSVWFLTLSMGDPS